MFHDGGNLRYVLDPCPVVEASLFSGSGSFLTGTRLLAEFAHIYFSPLYLSSFSPYNVCCATDYHTISSIVDSTPGLIVGKVFGLAFFSPQILLPFCLKASLMLVAKELDFYFLSSQHSFKKAPGLSRCCFTIPKMLTFVIRS